MGTVTARQSTPASAPEQSSEAVPGAGDTHDGAGGGGRHTPDASAYSHPEGQTPASGSSPMQPKGGYKQIWSSEQNALPQANIPASAEAPSTKLASAFVSTDVEVVQADVVLTVVSTKVH
jgi:hypothetical protein